MARREGAAATNPWDSRRRSALSWPTSSCPRRSTSSPGRGPVPLSDPSSSPRARRAYDEAAPRPPAARLPRGAAKARRGGPPPASSPGGGRTVFARSVSLPSRPPFSPRRPLERVFARRPRGDPFSSSSPPFPSTARRSSRGAARRRSPSHRRRRRGSSPRGRRARPSCLSFHSRPVARLPSSRSGRRRRARRPPPCLFFDRTLFDAPYRVSGALIKHFRRSFQGVP